LNVFNGTEKDWQAFLLQNGLSPAAPAEQAAEK